MARQIRNWLQHWLICGLLLVGVVTSADRPASPRHMSSPKMAHFQRQPYQLAPIGKPHSDADEQVSPQFSPAVPLTYENLKPEQYHSQVFGSNLQPPNAEFYQFSPPAGPAEHHSAPAKNKMHAPPKDHPHHAPPAPSKAHKEGCGCDPAEPQFAPAIRAPTHSAQLSAKVTKTDQQMAPPAMSLDSSLAPVNVYSAERRPQWAKSMQAAPPSSKSQQQSALPFQNDALPVRENTVSVAVKHSPSDGSYGYAYSYPTDLRSNLMPPAASEGHHQSAPPAADSKGHHQNAPPAADSKGHHQSALPPASKGHHQDAPPPASKGQHQSAPPPADSKGHHQSAPPPGASKGHHQSAPPPADTKGHHQSAQPPDASKGHHQSAPPPAASKGHHQSAPPPHASHSPAANQGMKSEVMHQMAQQGSKPASRLGNPGTRVADSPWNLVNSWSINPWRREKAAALYPPDMFTTWPQNTRVYEWPKPAGAHGVAHPSAQAPAVASMGQSKPSGHLNVHVKNKESQ